MPMTPYWNNGTMEEWNIELPYQMNDFY